MQLFEKRGGAVKSKEVNIWKDVAPNMMSEEEEYIECGTPKFRKHRQSWKSERFTHLLDKLDQRLKIKSPKGIARERCYGEPLDARTPPSVKPLMKCLQRNSEADKTDFSEQELFMSTDTDKIFHHYKSLLLIVLILSLYYIEMNCIIMHNINNFDIIILL